MEGFKRRRFQIYALNAVSFSLAQGETLGIVGESGCGKSTLLRSLVGLEPVHGGTVRLSPPDAEAFTLNWTDRSSMQRARRLMQIIFQNPFSSVNPRHTVRQIVGEPLKVNGFLRGRALDQRVEELLESVGIQPAYAERYPASFSGGQMQRIVIARALSLQPPVILADEPVSALDVSVQAQILNMLMELKKRLGLSLLFVSHNVDVVRHMSDRIAVMYLGKIVEMGLAGEVYFRPRHPYTQSLIASIPRLAAADQPGRREAIKGEIPDPANLPAGCAFHPRCPLAAAQCREQAPALTRQEHGTHFTACHQAASEPAIAIRPEVVS
jgi:oligopeptide/dipeptide ABC transporter ATP-binding protein